MKSAGHLDSLAVTGAETPSDDWHCHSVCFVRRTLNPPAGCQGAILAPLRSHIHVWVMVKVRRAHSVCYVHIFPTGQ